MPQPDREHAHPDHFIAETGKSGKEKEQEQRFGSQKIFIFNVIQDLHRFSQ